MCTPKGALMQYRVVVGLNLPPDDVRYEPGELLDDKVLLKGASTWMLADGLIEPLDAKSAEPEPEPDPEPGSDDAPEPQAAETDRST